MNDFFNLPFDVLRANILKQQHTRVATTLVVDFDLNLGLVQVNDFIELHDGIYSSTVQVLDKPAI